jgi:hypothetical protein
MGDKMSEQCHLAIFRAYAKGNFRLRQHGTLCFMYVIFTPQGENNIHKKNPWDA